MASFNKIILIGRLTRDPEMRYTSGGLAIAKFAVAVDRRFKNQQGEKETDFFDCSAFRQTAEFVSQYLGKGRLVAVEGRIEFNEVEQQDGSRRRYTNVICDQVQGLDSAREGGEGYNAPQGGAQGGGAQGGGYGGSAGGAAGYDDYQQEQPPAQPPRNAAPARPAPSRPAAAGAAPGGAPAGGAPQGGAPQGGAPQRPAPRQPEPAYPADDYDDADPFADE
jgi:single-strand DNA-binding protein